MKITPGGLAQSVEDWIGAGIRVTGPAAQPGGRVAYRRLRSANELLLEGFVRPGNSIKETVFPRTERLYGYRIKGNQIELIDAAPEAAPQIVVAARPCDAAALPMLDAVFNWDYVDEFYNARRSATTVVTLACKAYDDRCFCTSVGLGPAATSGSDAMLYETEPGRYEVRVFTGKGRALFPEAEGGPAEPLVDGPGRKFEGDLVREYLTQNFDSALWKQETMRCLGCGVCAYMCPTCHCFDIVDEHQARVRNWDSCQYALFTLHASGHNPRHLQPERQRQRIYHKFDIYPRKFGHILCTGCGNCTRNCPVDLGLLNLLTAVDDEQHLQA